MSARRLFGFMLIMRLASAAAAEPYETIRGASMGTTYTIKVASRNEDVCLECVADVARSELYRLERIFPLYRTDSELSRWNAAPAGEWLGVSPDLHAVATRAIEIAAKTGGAFDPTVAPLVRLWRKEILSVNWKPPTGQAISQAKQTVDYRLIELRSEPPAIKKRFAGVELDLNALVEGWAIDRLVDLLRKSRIDNALVELGGELRGLGRRGDGREWHVAIEDPCSPGQRYATVPLTGQALATSGDYRQRIVYEGQAFSHILDARTGRPIDHALTAVSVVAEDAFTADAWATALLILGPDQGRAVAEEEGLAASFVYRQPGLLPHLTSGAIGRVHLTLTAGDDQLGRSIFRFSLVIGALVVCVTLLLPTLCFRRHAKPTEHV
jgi:thiamine biosynthesis lipoprotein